MLNATLLAKKRTTSSDDKVIIPSRQSNILGRHGSGRMSWGISRLFGGIPLEEGVGFPLEVEKKDLFISFSGLIIVP